MEGAELMRNKLAILLLLATLSVQAEITFRGAWIATVANIDWPSAEAVGQTDL